MRAVILLISIFTQAPVPSPSQSAPPYVAPTVAPPVDPRKEMLKNLLQAGVLLLEGKAYRQFIQAFVDDEDRRKFEQVFGKNGFVDYNEWGKEKGSQMLEVLNIIKDVEPVLRGNRACYVTELLPRGKFSFVFVKGGWFIENKSGCPDSLKPAKKDGPPVQVPVT